MLILPQLGLRGKFSCPQSIYVYIIRYGQHPDLRSNCRVSGGVNLGDTSHLPVWTFPKASAIKVFTLPSPKGSVPEYPTMEIRGMVYYRFIAKPPVVADAPYPYEV